MTEAEMSLFESGTGNGQRMHASSVEPTANSHSHCILIQVPIIAIFMKMDALDARAFNELMLDDIPYAKAKEQAPARGEDIFEKNYLERLQGVQYMPRHVVRLRGMLLLVDDTATCSAIHHTDMHKEGTSCDELIMRTSQALDRNTLRLFCLSILRNDIESRIKQVINQ
jgi:hypothetical protein